VSRALKKNVNAPAHSGTSLCRKSYIVDVANPRSIVVSVDVLQQSFSVRRPHKNLPLPH
jgi:threonine/homoserine/homoserine lactone efflux protein